MCGILGVFNFNKQIRFDQFERSLQLLKHRGPDSQQAKQLDEFVIFGHTRLSIIDLSTSSNQPFSVDSRYTLTYNGEIYNYLEIREELRTLGIEFHSNGDTEVVLQAYKTWGEDCVKRFNGMWSFAIYDNLKNELFCSRDRFGVKPFNYYFSDQEFIFSSEIKPIIYYRPELKRPNYNLIANYVYKSLGAQAEETWFENILRLAPGHNLTIKQAEIKISRYWEYPQKVSHKITFDEAQQEFERIFKDAVRIRMRSDVPVGSTLSSGLDSSSIVGVLNKLDIGQIETFTAFSRGDTFTANDKQAFSGEVEFDESIVAKKLAADFNVKLNLIEVSFDDYVHRLSETIYFLESGHSSPATVCIHQVYKDARRKIKVLLEGQGADELLAGYVVDNFPYYIYESFRNGRVAKALNEFKSFIKIYSLKHLVLMFLRRFDLPIINYIKNAILGIDVVNKKAHEFKYVPDNRKEKVKFDELFNYGLYKQHSSGLVNLLHYGDALSMAESIESRLPFMDYRLVEYAFTLPYDFKLNLMQGKFIQRKALQKYLPDYVSKSLIKIGFATPLDKILRNSPDVEEILLHQSCGDLFNQKNVAKLLKKLKDGKGNYSSILFRILSAKIWYNTFFVEDFSSFADTHLSKVKNSNSN